MKHTISFNIECGKTTCASQPGQFCEHLGVKNFGIIPVCMLFGQDLIIANGWTQRCDKCMEKTGDKVAA